MVYFARKGSVMNSADITVKLIIFFTSLVFSSIIVYILGFLWFGDTRNRQSKSFFMLGTLVTLWTLLNATAIISDKQLFPFIYSVRICFVAIIPFAVFWFILNFARVKYVQSRIFLFLVWLFPALDVLAMLTNPLHHFMFLDYVYPTPTRALGFWIHTAGDFIVLIITFVVLLRYIFKNARNEPLVIAAGFGTFLPYILNMLYTSGFRYIPYDITPLGFFVTFMLFSISSYRSQLFNVKALTLTSIYNLLKDVILVINERGIVKDASPAAADAFPDFVFAMGNSSVKDFFNYLVDKSVDYSPENLLDPVIKGITERNGEIRICREDGREVTFTFTLRSIFSRSRPTGSILVMSDVSIYRSMISEINGQNIRLEELTKAAEAASMAKSSFLTNMSHEIRTPLNAIIGMALIARKSAEDKKTLNAIEEIENASKHLLGVLNNILDMSKIESGKFELVNDSFPLITAMSEVAELIRHRCNEKNVDLKLDFDKIRNYNVLGDQLRLKQILLNLLGNAVKFTPEYGVIIFSYGLAEESSETVRIHFAVSDNGIGMTNEQMGRLFNTFSQADATIFSRFGGTGLGLSISQNLAQMMGGLITVKSTQGEGSTFELTLNFPKTKETVSQEKDLTELIPDLSGKRLLIVEDMEINRIILRELLLDTLVEIEDAVNGEDAIIAFNESPPYYFDLIFMDVQMPITDGYEATRRIRQLNRPDARTVPIVAMTANVYKEDIEKALASGMNSHLAKPIDIAAVMKVLSEKLKKS
jgi:signal transduction histidine kinase/CheY-like chemotaxis protein